MLKNEQKRIILIISRILENSGFRVDYRFHRFLEVFGDFKSWWVNYIKNYTKSDKINKKGGVGGYPLPQIFFFKKKFFFLFFLKNL